MGFRSGRIEGALVSRRNPAYYREQANAACAGLTNPAIRTHSLEVQTS